MQYRVYDKLDELLRQRGWSRRKLAMEAGINLNTMSALFARRPEPLPDKYLRPMAEALGVDIKAFDPMLLEAEYAQKALTLIRRSDRCERYPEVSPEIKELVEIASARAWEKQRLQQARHLSNDVRKIMSHVEGLSDEDIDALELAIFYLRLQRAYLHSAETE